MDKNNSNPLSLANLCTKTGKKADRLLTGWTKMRRHVDGEDIGQLCAVRFLEHEIPTLEPGRSLEGTLSGIARNELIAISRRCEHQRVSSGIEFIAIDEWLNPEKQCEELELSELLQEYVEQLPPLMVLVIRLRHWEGMKPKQIGSVLGLPAKSVSQLLWRAHKILSPLLAKLFLDHCQPKAT
jgi:RNA polymerase sigma factor (sigma-70 family)